nr:hypothetical protein [Tanacetum cinerariifolium]
SHVASLLWRSSGVSSGSGVEVVEWSVEWGRGGEWGWWENQLECYSSQFKSWEGWSTVGFLGVFTQLVPGLTGD